MEQEKNIAEAEQEILASEVDEQIESEVERAKKRRREAIFELGLFFVLGVLIGITLKTEAVKKITMGFNDYQIQKPAQSYDVSALKKKLEEEFNQQQAAQQAQQEIQAQQGQINPEANN